MLAELSRKTTNTSDRICGETLQWLHQLAIQHESMFFLYQYDLLQCIRALYSFNPEEAHHFFRKSAEYLSNDVLSPEIIEEHNALVDLFDELMERRSPVVAHTGSRFFALLRAYRVITDSEALLDERLSEEAELHVKGLVARGIVTPHEIWDIYWMVNLASHYRPVPWGPMISSFLEKIKPLENEVFRLDTQLFWIAFFSFRTAEWWPSEPGNGNSLKRWVSVETSLEPRGSGAHKETSPTKDTLEKNTAEAKSGLLAETMDHAGMNAMFHPGFAAYYSDALNNNDFKTGLHLIRWLKRWPAVFRQKLLYDLLIQTAGKAAAQKKWKRSWKYYEATTRLLLNIQRADDSESVGKLGAQSSGFQPHAEILFEHLQGRSHTHFLFNCLNSMHWALYELPADKIGQYLSQIRSILSYRFSAVYTSSVSLDEELQFLYDYLCMEQFRFKERLTFSISADLDYDLRNIRIAPMIIQPILENAIKHGIRSLDDGRIEISVQHTDEGFLVFKVYDNGIGMNAERDPENASTAEPDSGQGQRLLEHGFNMIRMFWGKSPSIAYLTGKAVPENRGTLVEITLPYTIHYANG